MGWTWCDTKESLDEVVCQTTHEVDDVKLRYSRGRVFAEVWLLLTELGVRAGDPAGSKCPIFRSSSAILGTLKTSISLSIRNVLRPTHPYLDWAYQRLPIRVESEDETTSEKEWSDSVVWQRERSCRLERQGRWQRGHEQPSWWAGWCYPGPSIDYIRGKLVLSK